MHRNKAYSQEEVLAAFKEAHGDLYDYSKVVYTGNVFKVTIGCPIHGWFEQTPKSHKRGIGCAQCGPARCGKSRKITLEEFIRRSRVHHGNKFDYSLVDLEKNGIKDKVIIVCPTHGRTSQQAYHHMSGFGCKKCDAQRIGDMSKITHDEFIGQCVSRHGNQYDYSKTKYTGSKKKVCITCKHHGDFYMEAGFHSRRGYGCHKCWRSQGERMIANWLDSNNIAYESEKTFDDCRSPKGRMMKFDFHILSHNLIIEFDGQQHYYATEMFGGEEAFKRNKLYDSIKNRYAKKKGIRLLRIPFFKMNNISSLLEEATYTVDAAA